MQLEDQLPWGKLLQHTYLVQKTHVTKDSAAHVYGDNMCIINNTSKPESNLNKKSNAVCYHTVRGSVAIGKIITAHIPGAENPADLMTKVLSGSKHHYLVQTS